MTSPISGRNSQPKQQLKNVDPSNQIVDVVPETATAKKNLSKVTNSKSSPPKGSCSINPPLSPPASSPSPSASKMGVALGMIETRGLVPAIEAADAMTKAAEVSLIAREFIGGGYVSVLVRGETGAVNASVRAGADACERVGDGLVAAHILSLIHI